MTIYFQLAYNSVIMQCGITGAEGLQKERREGTGCTGCKELFQFRHPSPLHRKNPIRASGKESLLDYTFAKSTEQKSDFSWTGGRKLTGCFCKHCCSR